MKTKKGMVFGVFDGLHEGHKNFLQQARALCDELIVVVAQEDAVRALKGHDPRQGLAERMRAIQDFDQKLTVVPGDNETGMWHILDEHDPGRVFLGYDQQGIGDELKKLGIPFTYLGAHEPERYKSSLNRFS